MLETFFTKVWSIWIAGGWTMIPMAVLSVFIYSSAIQLLLHFRERRYYRASRDTWTRWLQGAEEGPSEVREIVRYTQDDVRSLDEVHDRFAEVVAAQLPLVDRRLVFLNILITAAPLVGLLGTVTGMLLTFQALGSSGGEITDLMSAGISQALFPPEVGLCVALPGLALVHVIKRKRNEFEAFLARLESATVQMMRKTVAEAAVVSERAPAEAEEVTLAGWGVVRAPVVQPL